MIELLIVSLSVILLLFVELLNYQPKALFGIYQRRNGMYWFKVGFMYVLLSLRKLRKKNVQVDMRSEGPQELSKEEKAIDATYLNGSNDKGDFLVMNIARRKPPLTDGFLYLKLTKFADLLLETPKLPDTTLDSESEKFEAEGLKFENIVPMQKWRFSYSGKMKEFADRNRWHDVEIDAIWTAESDYINFDRDIDSFSFAKSAALEKWSRSYFKNLQGNHQTHYEQYGILKGKAVIDGREFNIELNTVRDHTVGSRREWKQFKRYVLHYFADGKGNFYSLGVICTPISFSNLLIGYVYSAKHNKLSLVKTSDFNLFQHGADSKPPKDYAFTFTTDEDTYTVEVDVKERPYFYISKDWEVKIFECPCEYRVNGTKAWGAAEWCYRNVRGRHIE